MSSSLKEALKEAIKKANQANGVERPSAEAKIGTIKSDEKSTPVKTNKGSDCSNPIEVSHEQQAEVLESQSKFVEPSLPKSTAKPNHMPDESDFVLNFSENNPIQFEVTTEPEIFNYLPPSLAGHQTQIHDGSWRDEREIVIGLDFGTSSVKVIIGDKTLDNAFAVPFSAHEGINRYLLPSRLYENGSTNYSLSAGKSIQRDLKLALLAYPNNRAAHIKVITFLALVIKHARGWLLSQHKSVYQSSNILWKLVLGLPSAHHLNNEHHDLFLKLATYAWALSIIDSTTINLSNTLKVMNEEFTPVQSDTAEICVVPEIAAQIYGYVSSNSFDPNARNNYLMVDIGAGTVDSCLFNVKPKSGGKCDFKFFTTQVQPNGVMNLYRHHLDWWIAAMNRYHEKISIDLKDLKSKMFCTDRFSSIPESFKDYFSNISVTFKNGIENPDQYFFNKRLMRQVRGQTLWRTWKDGYLSQHDLTGIPMYLCGGGARMSFYKRLQDELPTFQGCSWLSAVPRKLEIPKRLIAPGLPPGDYDRLSVAYGLSFLEIRQVIQAIPEPLVLPEQSNTWDINYITKDMC